MNSAKRSKLVILARNRLLLLALNSSPSELLQAVLEEAESLTGSQVSFFYVLGEDERTLTSQTWSKNTIQLISPMHAQEMQTPVDQAGIWLDCIRLRAPLILNDFAANREQNGIPDEHGDLIRELLVPVIRGEKIVAIIGVGNKATVYHSQDVEVISFFADLAWDILERKQSEGVLDKNNKLTPIIVHTAGEMVLLIDVNGKVVAANESAAARLGLGIEELYGADIFRLQVGLEAENYRQDIHIALNEGRQQHFEYTSGEQWFENDLYPIIDVDGHFRWVAIFSLDITEQKHAEFARQESDIRYQLLFEEITQGVIILDHSGQVIETNPAAEKIFGFALTNLIAENSAPQHWRVFHEDGTLMAWETYPPVQVLSTGQPVRNVVIGFDHPLLGSRRWLNMNAIPRFRAGESQPYQVFSIFEDVTERKLLKENLEERVRQSTVEVRERETQYHSLFEQTHDAVFILDLSGHHIAVNQRAADMLGYTAEEMRKLSVKDLSAEFTQSENTLDKLMAGEQLPVYERLFRKKNGQLITVEITVELIRDQANQPWYIQSVARDITIRKQGEETLRRANLEMERAMRMKDEFLASMSHELRTPLTGILGITEGMQERVYGEVNERQVSALSLIYNSGQHLLDLINDILDVSKLEAGKLDLNFESCSVNQVCLASLQMVKGLAHKKGQQVRFSITPDDILLYADSRRMKQILVNLISNAIKFTPREGQLGLEVVGDEENQVVVLKVWDQGSGIKPEDLNKLFKPFVQLDSKLSRQQNGTGLGLVLVQKLVELHGGSLIVDSKYGEGSSFTVHLPWALEHVIKNDPFLDGTVSPASFEEAPMVFGDPSYPLVMLVDDDETNTEAIVNYLTIKKFRLVTARNGWEFLEKVYSIRPDIILMDIQMPGMDGLEAIQRFRKDTSSSICLTPVIAITALAMTGDRERCLAAGANEYISKPIRLRQLVQTIEICLGKNGPK